jgi:quercetin dioxygenase-like cupin family protein
VVNRDGLLLLVRSYNGLPDGAETPRETLGEIRIHKRQQPLLTFSIEERGVELLREAAASNGRAAKTMVNEGSLRIILLAMTKGTALNDHSVNGSLSVQVFQGKVSVETDGGNAVLAEGKVLALPPELVHNVTALEDAILQLTISKT